MNQTVYFTPFQSYILSFFITHEIIQGPFNPYPWIVDKKSANTLESHLNFWTSQIGVNSRPEDRIRGVTWNAQKRMWKRNLSCDGICIFFEMPQNRRCSFSVLFLFSKSNGKNGAFQKNEHKKEAFRKW